MFKRIQTGWAAHWARWGRVLVPVALAALLGLAWHRWGAMGVAAVGGGIVMWLLLHINRLLAVMRRAANAPIGSVASAVMLNARLKPGVTLLHVMALTRALGQELDAAGIPIAADVQREPNAPVPDEQFFRWSDNTGSHVNCHFHHGRLVAWQLHRPVAQAELGE